MEFPALEETEFRQIRDLMRRVSGITMADHKRQLVAGRLMKRVRALACGSFADYVGILLAPASDEERRLAVDLLTTNETYFFREEGHFQFLRQWAQQQSPPPLRFWSAACSSGEEVYSLAMLLSDVLPQANWQLHGSDLCRHALQTALAAVYPLSRTEAIPEAWKKRYCLKGIGEMDGYLQVGASLRRRVAFHCLNLNEPLPSDWGQFDVIFLRNMLIYFDAQGKQKIVQGLLPHLSARGLLFVGHSESLQGLSLPLVPCGPSVYRKAS
ncbi:CheR family methyltransferase [Pseudaeromonas sp. ZJS20]|uniref:CheR family methyltransferase n=1 Tax=Pseudaeromonas aegiceratis TaxID=3153928 RepID=UPI00390CB1EF